MREKRTNREWTKQELEVLHENYNDTSAKDLAALLPGRTVPAITNKLQKLGLRKLRPIDYWSKPDNLERLKHMFADIGVVTEVARKIGVGESTLGGWMAWYIDISQAVEAGRAQYRETHKPKTHKPKAVVVKPKAADPESKCATCEWARALVSSGNVVMCIWPTCIKEEASCLG